MSECQTFLYVEDTESDVFLMRTAIAQGGLAIALKSVADGEEAVRYLNGEGPFSDRRIYPIPTTMLLDLNLPRKSGFQVLEWLRQQPHLKRMIVIVFTASARQEDTDKSHELGANAVLVKPTTLADLVQLLDQLFAWLELTRKPRIKQN